MKVNTTKNILKRILYYKENYMDKDLIISAIARLIIRNNIELKDVEFYYDEHLNKEAVEKGY